MTSPPRELRDRLRRLRRRRDYVARWAEALRLVAECNAALRSVAEARSELVRQWHDDENLSYERISVELQAAGFTVTRAHLHKIAKGRADERSESPPPPQV